MGYDWNKLTSTSETARESGIKIVTYGKAGAGKTTLISTLTDDPESDVFMISAEGGDLPIRNFDIDKAPVETWDEFTDLLDEIDQGQKAGEFPYSAVAIDSFSEVVEACLERERELHPEDTWEQFGNVGRKAIAALKQIRDIRGLHFYVTCEQSREKFEGRGAVFAPSVPGNMATEKIPYIFDEIFALRAESNEDGDLERWLQTEPFGGYEAKDRSGALDTFEKPDLSHIIHKILGE